jgi:hypothetical protein
MNIQQTATKQLSLANIVGNVIKVLESEKDPILRLIGLVDKKKYIKLRQEINNSFYVGDIHAFKGIVAEDTEHGDIADTFIHDLQTRYPEKEVAGKVENIMLDDETRKIWRDELISELDDMVTR